MRKSKRASPCSCYYEKGKGYKPAEDDTIGNWHGTGPYKIENGAFVKSETTGPAWSSLIAETVRKIAHENERVVTITPAMPVGSKLQGIQKDFPNRFFDVGIAEQRCGNDGRRISYAKDEAIFSDLFYVPATCI